MHDYYETQAEGGSCGYCRRCNSFKPLTEFKRRLSRGAAQRQGYAGNVRVDVETYLCKSCQPKRKPPHKMTKKELLAKRSTGDIHPFIYDLMVKRRDAEELALQRRAAYTRWEKKRAEPWMYMVKAMNQEINAVKHQRYYAQKAGVADLLAYAVFYENELIKLRAWLRYCARTRNKKTDAPPDTLWWPSYFEPEVKDKVRELWLAMPKKNRANIRIPLLLQPHLAPADTSPDAMLKKEDRLAQAKASLKTYDTES